MKKKKKIQCELCKDDDDKARIFCESDQAYLCWDCDATVHSANFLVARHSRNILCRLCRSATPWGASGPKLTPTLCLCQRCLLFVRARRSSSSSVTHHHLQDRNNGETLEEETRVAPWSPPPSSEDDEIISGLEDERRRVVPEDATSPYDV